MSVSGGSKPPPYGWASGPAVKLAYGATLIIRLGTKSVILNEVKDLNLPKTRFFALLRMTDPGRDNKLATMTNASHPHASLRGGGEDRHLFCDV